MANDIGNETKGSQMNRDLSCNRIEVAAVAVNATKPIGRFLTVSADGSVSISGVDLPRKAKCIAINRESVVVKVPGHKRWSAIGQQTYTPAETQVFTIVKRLDDNADRFEVEPLISY